MPDQPHARHHHPTTSADDLDALLDLDAEVLHDYWDTALGWVATAAGGSSRLRVVDLGAGTGAGAIGLAQRFPDAAVTAIDITASSLERLRAKAHDLGLASRIRTIEADLDSGWPDLDRLDLIWASMSLHHLADPDRVLREVHGASNTGALIAVAEFSEALRFLPEDLGVGRPGFERRATSVVRAAQAAVLPAIGTNWAQRLAGAGWTVLAENAIAIDLDPPAHPSASAYARAWFTRLGQGLIDGLDADDRSTLAALLDGNTSVRLLEGANLHIRGIRTITLARRD